MINTILRLRKALREELEALRTILEVGLDSGTATGGSSTTLEDTAKDWGTDQWKDAYVEIVEGTGKGQIRKIAGNTSNTLTVSDAWTTTPDTTSKYRIFGAPSEVAILNSILSQLDITLSSHRDSIKAGVKVLDSGGSVINPAKEDGKLATLLSKIDEIEDALSSVGTDKLLVTPDNPPNLDLAISALRDALLAEESVYSQSFGLDETVAQEITLDTKGHKILEVYAKASTATDFTLDVSNDNTNWITSYMSWSSVTEVKETLWNGFRYVKLKSAAAGASGDTVDLVLATK